MTDPTKPTDADLDAICDDAFSVNHQRSAENRALFEAGISAERARDNPELDGTDGAHPAWWRGQEAGVKGERARRERKRGERPRAAFPPGHGNAPWEHGFSAGVAWADSGESEEMAELRERLQNLDSQWSNIHRHDEATIEFLESELSRLRANSYAAARDEFNRLERALFSADGIAFAKRAREHLDNIIDHSGGLSQQSAPQAAQKGGVSLSVLQTDEDIRRESALALLRELPEPDRSTVADRMLATSQAEKERLSEVREEGRCEGANEAHATHMAEITDHARTRGELIEVRDQLATVTRERDELKSALSSHDARRICRHVVAQLTEERDSLTRELAEAREEIRLAQPLIAVARREFAGGNIGLSDAISALDAHRAKASTEKGPGDETR